jgi:uncharacterized protein (TIGR00369 family)
MSAGGTPEGPGPGGILRTLGLAVVEAGNGRAVVEGTPDTSHCNPFGVVHGGYTATLLDNAIGVAVHTAARDGLGFTTLELKVSYLRAVLPGSGTVRGEATVTSIGRRVAFAEARLTDQQGRLCATASSTLISVERPAGS